jgi:very-short-patch-repair endonuclease
VAQSWAELTLDRPISIEGVSAEALRLSVESLPVAAPAIITYDAGSHLRPKQVVETLLTQLDRIARELFPAWLLEAAPIDSAAGAGVAAVRSMALHAAHTSGQYGPFVADLAERALRRQVMAKTRFSPEVRAEGLAKIIAASFGRTRTAILVQVPDELTVEDHQALVAGGRWLSDNGGFGIWFTGAALTAVDTVEVVGFRPPTDGPLMAGEPGHPQDPDNERVVGYPAIAGIPHPGSCAEQLLEAALRPHDWADGREWNQLYRPHTLTNPVRIDLLWRKERCIVEIDGPEHCEPTRFAADRQRDVLLQLAGYAVLRFTNRQVLQHRDLVLAQIQIFLAGRRAENDKGATHAGTEAVSAGAGTPAHPIGRKR